MWSRYNSKRTCSLISSTMRKSTWILVTLVTFCTIKADDSRTHQTSSGLREVFCMDGAVLFFVSAANDITSPSTSTRLRILRLQDGKLLLYMEPQLLVYPVIPNVTPVFLSEEYNFIMLPDLEHKGAAIGLQLPGGLHVAVHDLLHQPPLPEDIAQVVTRAESLAAGLVHRAETMGGMINEKAASLQVGRPAAPDAHPHLKAGAHYTRAATEKVVGVTTWATDTVGQATLKLGQLVRPALPNFNRKTGRKKVGNPEDKIGNNPTKEVTNDITGVTTEALGKIAEALQKSAQILADSLRENTVQVVQHNFGEDMGEAVGDMYESVKNTVTAAQHIRSLRANRIVLKTVGQIISTDGEKPQYKCKDNL